MRHHVLALGVGLALLGPASATPTDSASELWEREGIAHLSGMLAQARRDGTRLLVGLAGSPG